MLPQKLKNKFGVNKLYISGKSILVGIPYLWLLIFFLCPCLILLKISFTESVLQIPPYSAISKWLSNNIIQINLNITSYRLLLTDELYAKTFIDSITIAGSAAIACLIIGYPMAYAIVRSRSNIRLILLTLVILPFWTSFLIRVYAWVILLAPTGLINNFLIQLGIIENPLKLSGNCYAVTIGIIYTYLPFMVLPLYSAIEKIDFTFIEAAYDLGSTPIKAFFSIIMPLSMRGIVTGFFLVFMPAIGEYVIPEILGDPSTVTMGRVVWNEFFTNLSWPVASALAVSMILFVVFPVVLWYSSRQNKSNKNGQIVL